MATPAYGSDDPERLSRSPAQYASGTFSSYRQEVAPVDLTRSRRQGVVVQACPECWGPFVKDDRGGPVISHQPGCSIPPRPRSWPKRAAATDPFKGLA